MELTEPRHAADTIRIQPATRTGAEPGPPGGRGAGLEQQPDRPLPGLNSEAAFGRLFIGGINRKRLSALGRDVSSWHFSSIRKLAGS
jgi:hypothetical protein